ncbi:hypothetical protein LOTGIDRAFT_88625, partial [Lottia gigantea]
CQWCPVGEFLVTQCERDREASICETCPEKQFRDKPNNKTCCNDCTFCALGKEIVKNCTKTSDTVCKCPPGKHWHD